MCDQRQEEGPLPADDIGESSSKNSTTGIADRQYDDGEEGKLAERSPTEVLRNTDESQPGRSAGKKMIQRM